MSLVDYLKAQENLFNESFIRDREKLEQSFLLTEERIYKHMQSLSQQACEYPYSHFQEIIRGLLFLELFVPFSENSFRNHIVWASVASYSNFLPSLINTPFYFLYDLFNYGFKAALYMFAGALIQAWFMFISLVFDLSLIALSFFTRTLSTVYYIGKYAFSENTSEDDNSLLNEDPNDYGSQVLRNN